MAPVQLKVFTDTETWDRLHPNGVMVDLFVDTFQTLFETRITAKCKFNEKTPYVLITILDLTKEVLPLLWGFKEGDPVPLLIQKDVFTLRLIDR